MNRVPDTELVLVPGGTLLTATPEEGRALAIAMARHMIHNIQPDLDVLKDGRPKYGTNPDSLIAASQVDRSRVPDDRCRQQLLAKISYFKGLARGDASGTVIHHDPPDSGDEPLHPGRLQIPSAFRKTQSHDGKAR